MGRKQTESVTDLPQGTPIWIFWDEDQQFYKGQVGALIDNGTKITILYPENEEQEDIDIADFENGTILYSLKPPGTEEIQVLEEVPGVGVLGLVGVREVTRVARVSQSGIPLIQQLRKLGKAMHDIEDRLPVEGLNSECDSVWLTWRASVATAKSVEDLAMMLIYLSQEMKPNVTKDWWKEESQFWRISVSGSKSVDELQEYIMELITLAINWDAAKALFPQPTEPYPEGTDPPTPRKNRVALTEPRKRRKFETVKPVGSNGPPKLKPGFKNGSKQMLMLKRLGKLSKGPKKLKMAGVAGDTEEGGVKKFKKKLKRKREDGEGGVNKRPKSAIKVGGVPRPPLVMPALPPIGEKLSAEGLDAKDGVVPATVAVVCNSVQAEYIPESHMVACRCGQCGAEGKLLTCQQFEAHTGSRAKKWKETIRLAALPPTRLSEWLLLMEKQGVSGVAFVAIESKRVKSLTSPTSGGGGVTAGNGASAAGSRLGNADAAKLRKAFAVKRAKEQIKKANADVGSRKVAADVAPTADVARAADVAPAAAMTAGMGPAVADVAGERDHTAAAAEPSVTAGTREAEVGGFGVREADPAANDGLKRVQFEVSVPEPAGEVFGDSRVQEERAAMDLEEEDPLGWFTETYISPRGGNLDGLFSDS